MTFRTLVVAAVLAAAGPATLAHAQDAPPGANPQAEQLNEQGKELYKRKDYAGAARKFADAIAIQPDSRYYFNLCATLEKTGDYQGALDACGEVYAHNPEEKLKAKAGERMSVLRKKIKEQPQPPTGGTPGGADPGTGQPPVDPTTGQPTGPAPGPYPGGGTGTYYDETTTTPGPGEYGWAVGGHLGFWGATGGYSHEGGAHIQVHLDFMLAQQVGLGLRTYFGYGTLTGGERDLGLMDLPDLGIAELGAGLYWHLGLTDDLLLTPMAGVHFAAMGPTSEEELSFATFGIRAEVALDYRFGYGKSHVISLAPNFTAYLPATSATDGNAAFYGIQDGGAMAGLTVSYTKRFRDIASLVTLE